MALIIGMDEAGYGPRLGPLVTSAAVFRCECAPCSLWAELSAVITSDVRAKDRLVVSDSKRVYGGSGGGLGRLEEAVLAFLDAAGVVVRSSEELLRALCGDDDRACCPWYGTFGRELPCEADGTLVAARADALRRALRARSIEFAGLASRVVVVPRFNEEIARTGNKANVLFATFASLLQGMLDATDDGVVLVEVDRLGGRHYYSGLLATAWPFARIRPVAESPRESRYAMTIPHGRRREISIAFTVAADAESLPVALASMVSKYVRELHMAALNDWWRRIVPGLRATAGYHQDASRFIEEIEPCIRDAGIDRLALVRQR